YSTLALSGGSGDGAESTGMSDACTCTQFGSGPTFAPPYGPMDESKLSMVGWLLIVGRLTTVTMPPAGLPLTNRCGGIGSNPALRHCEATRNPVPVNVGTASSPIVRPTFPA